ncbi:hypothetical protein JYT48_00175 [Mariprofundus ferrooxydans]|nr:hypothetical protein [Mariprofundus ferrooxydans]
MKTFVLTVLFTLISVPIAYAVPIAEDIATTIKLRGFDCGGREVSNINQQQDAQGNKTIQATCPNGIRYQINISASGRVSVTRL